MFDTPPTRPSPLKRLLRAWRRRVIIALLAFATLYGILAIRFYSKHPKITRNLAAEFNKRVEAVPEPERAMPLYVEALGKFTRLNEAAPEVYEKYKDIGPDHRLWPKVLEYLTANGQTLNIVRSAAERPALGWILTDGLSPEFAKANGREPTQGTPNPPVLDWKLGHLGQLRQFAQLLFLDARAAASAHDANRVESDIRAMLAIGDQLREHPILISDLVSFAIYSLAFDALGIVIAEQPQLLSDAQLDRLDKRIAGIAAGNVCVRLDGERAFVADLLQRFYSDDGAGDGEMTADGLRGLSQLAGRSGKLEPSLAALAPFGFERWPSRKEVADAAESMFRRFETDMNVPAWQRTDWSVESELDSPATGPALRRRLGVAAPFIPAFSKSARAAEVARQRQESSRALIALERYRLAHGTFPEDLESLTPTFLPSVPLDLHDGKPMKYILKGDHPLLYSCGADGDDDGGVPPAGHFGNTRAAAFYTLLDRARAADGDWIAWPPPPPEPEEEPEGE